MAPELRAYGVPHPVEYLISPDGVVIKKYFVPSYQHRVTAAAVALEQFGQVSGRAPEIAFERGPVGVRIGLSSATAFAGQEVRFFARFVLQPGWHIYGTHSPEGCTATSIEFEGSAVMRQDLRLPEPEMIQFPSLNQKVPVYSGSVEIQGTLLLRYPLPEGELSLPGRLRFQPCSQTVCEPPQTIPFSLPLTLHRFVITERDRELQERNR